MKSGSAEATCIVLKAAGALIFSLPRALVQAGYGRIGLVQLVENPVAVLEIGFADLGQAETAGASMQQANAQFAFEAGNGLACPAILRH